MNCTHNSLVRMMPGNEALRSVLWAVLFPHAGPLRVGHVALPCSTVSQNGQSAGFSWSNLEFLHCFEQNIWYNFKTSVILPNTSLKDQTSFANLSFLNVSWWFLQNVVFTSPSAGFIHHSFKSHASKVTLFKPCMQQNETRTLNLALSSFAHLKTQRCVLTKPVSVFTATSI